jgi:hypothetical protein
MGNSPHEVGKSTKLVDNARHFAVHNMWIRSLVCIGQSQLCKRESLNHLEAKAPDGLFRREFVTVGACVNAVEARQLYDCGRLSASAVRWAPNLSDAPAIKCP